MEMFVIAALIIGALMVSQYNKAAARRVKRVPVRSNTESSYRQTSVPDDRC